MTFILLALALAPAIAIILLVYIKDKYEKEPFSLILKCFIFGLFTIIPPIVVESAAHMLSPKQTTDPAYLAIYAFAVVGLSEEFSKFLLLRIYPYKRDHFNEPFDGIVYAVAIAMGFAAAENFFYVLEGGMSTAILRMFTAIPAHAAFGVLMGYYVGRSKFSKNRSLLLVQGLLAATVAHGFYDYFLFRKDIPGLAILTLVTLVAIIIISFKEMKSLQRISPFR